MEKKKLSIGTVIILLVIVAVIAVGATYMITKTEKQNTNSNGVEKKTSNSDISKESDVANSEIPKNNTEDKKDSEDKYFILYEGKEIENKTGIQNLSDMKMAFVYSGVQYDQMKLLDAVKEELPGVPLIGNTSFTGVVTPEGYITGEDGFAGIMALSDADLTVGVAGMPKEGTARETGHKVAEKAMKAAGKDEAPAYF